MPTFISEDDIKTFEGWLMYQGVDQVTTPAEELETWRSLFDDVRRRSSLSPKVGLMKLQPVTGEHRYAVAVREGTSLWLVLWVRRSRKSEFFVMRPCGDRDWDPHTSYHLDGAMHMKSYGDKVFAPTKPPFGNFKGTETLGAFFGYGPKGVGAICDPKAFSGIVQVAPGILGPRDGGITVDLIEPGCEPPAFQWKRIIQRDVFRDAIPWVVITVGSLS